MTRINQLMSVVFGVVIGGFFAGKSVAGPDAEGHWDHTGSKMQTVGGIDQVGINKVPANDHLGRPIALDVAGNIRSTQYLQLGVDHSIQWLVFNGADNTSISSGCEIGQSNAADSIFISTPDGLGNPTVRFEVEGFTSDGLVLVGRQQHPLGLEDFPGVRQFQVHGGIRAGSIGLGLDEASEPQHRVHVRNGSIVSENNIGVGPGFKVDWIDPATTESVGVSISHSLADNSLTIVAQPPVQPDPDNPLAGQIATFEPSGRVLVGFPDHPFGEVTTTLMQIHGITRTGAIVIGGTSPEDEVVAPACPLDVLGEARIQDVPQDDTLDKIVVWDDATGKLRHRAADTVGGAGGGPPCTSCLEVQTSVFEAVCKIFAGEIGNEQEVNECVTVIAQLILVGATICETDCLTIIQGNVGDLIAEQKP